MDSDVEKYNSAVTNLFESQSVVEQTQNVLKCENRDYVKERPRIGIKRKWFARDTLINRQGRYSLVSGILSNVRQICPCRALASCTAPKATRGIRNVKVTVHPSLLRETKKAFHSCGRLSKRGPRCSKYSALLI